MQMFTLSNVIKSDAWCRLESAFISITGFQALIDMRSRKIYRTYTLQANHNGPRVSRRVVATHNAFNPFVYIVCIAPTVCDIKVFAFNA